MKLFRILDPFTLTLITVVLLASFFPARGDFVPFFENLTTAAIALLFFMHGAKLSREAIIAGGGHWRLHLWVMCSTFVLFPILGVLFAWWKPVNVDPMLYSGFLYLCILGKVQNNRTGTSAFGKTESLVKDLRHHIRIVNTPCSFNKGLVDVVLRTVAMHIDFLMRMTAVVVARHVACDDYHRDGVESRVRNAGGRIRETGP